MSSRSRKLLWITAAMSLSAAMPLWGQDRTSVIHPLVVQRGERGGDVTCYFCSVRILGQADGDVAAIGGNVEIDGPVSGDVVAVGGDVTLGPAARVARDVAAVGGLVHKHAGAVTQAADPPVSLPWFFLPGQRHLAWRGVVTLAGFYLLTAVLFAALLRVRRLERLGESIRRWHVSVPTGILLGAALFFGFNFTDRFGRWADWVDYGLIAIALILLGAGFAGLAYVVGALFLPRTTATCIAIGTALLVALQLVPIAGALAFLLTLALALGSAAWGGLGFRGGGNVTLPPYPTPPSSPVTGGGPRDLLPR